MNKTLPIVEIFGPTIQGEGAVIGRRTMFVRFGYCDGAGKSGWCTWCDSMYAVDPVNKPNWRQMTAKQVAFELLVKSNPTMCRNVTFTGGNPAIHDLGELIEELGVGWNINVETQGTVFQHWMVAGGISCLTVSPKPPSAGQWNEERFQKFIDQARPSRTVSWSVDTALKIVVGPDELDYSFAQYVIRRYGYKFDHISLSALTDPWIVSWYTKAEAIRNLAERVCQDPEMGDVHVLFQYHTLLWGDQKGV